MNLVTSIGFQDLTSLWSSAASFSWSHSLVAAVHWTKMPAWSLLWVPVDCVAHFWCQLNKSCSSLSVYCGFSIDYPDWNGHWHCCIDKTWPNRRKDHRQTQYNAIRLREIPRFMEVDSNGGTAAMTWAHFSTEIGSWPRSILFCQFKCCGITGPRDWLLVFENSTLPEGCCKVDTPDIGCTQEHEGGVFESGCLPEITEYLESKVSMIGFSVIGLALFQVRLWILSWEFRLIAFVYLFQIVCLGFSLILYKAF